MTPEAIAGVVAVIATAFGRPVTDVMLDVYAHALEDLEVEDPVRLATDLARISEKWVSPAAIRHHVLAAAGIMAVDEDQAWRMVLEAIRRRETADLPWAIHEALESVGGPWGFRTGTETTIRAQFRDAYRRSKAREDQESLSRSWKGLPLNPGEQLQLRHGRDGNSRPDGGGRARDDEG